MTIVDSHLKNSGRWRALMVLAVITVLSMSAWFSAAAVLPQLRAEWGLAQSTAAWLTISVQLGFVSGALISGVLNVSDLVPARRVILISAVGVALANLLLLVAGGPGAGIPLRFVTGFFFAGVYPPAMKIISTWFRRDRGLALGILVAAISFGNGLPHLINALGGLDWRLVLSLTSACNMAAALLATLAIREGPYPFPAAKFDPSQVWRIFGERGVRLACFGYFGHMWELFAMYAWFLAFFSAALTARGLPVGSTAALATFAAIAVGAVGAWGGGILADRWGRTNTSAWMLAVSGSCSLLIGLFFHSPTWLLLLVGLAWGIAVVGDSAQYSAMVTELADQAYVGTALTLQTALGFALTAFTIWLVPVAAAGAGWQWVFALLAPGPALGILAMLRLRSLPEARHIAGGLG